jgi:hypothetical protein
MENNSAFDSFELQLTESAKLFLRETAKWGRFLSIVGYVVIGLMVLGAFAMFALGGAMESLGGGMAGGMMAMGGTAIGIIYLLIALLYFFPVMYLYKFSTKTLAAFNNNNTEQLTDAFENLKSHYKFVGILTAIVLGIYALFFVLGLFAALAAF